jgi:hypothetical protein
MRAAFVCVLAELVRAALRGVDIDIVKILVVYDGALSDVGDKREVAGFGIRAADFDHCQRVESNGMIQ